MTLTWACLASSRLRFSSSISSFCLVKDSSFLVRYSGVFCSSLDAASIITYSIKNSEQGAEQHIRRHVVQIKQAGHVRHTH